MHRNQYDTDVTTFTPTGRIHQVDYALNAVKKGTTTCGLRSDKAVVICAIKRRPSELGSYQEKIFKIDEHMGVSTSGLIADAPVLARYMRNECLNHLWAFESHHPVGRLVGKVSDKSQVYTQKAEKRPYGVGMLVAGYDKTGPHLYETKPSGDFFEFVAQAIGARPQAAKTYFEKRFESFPGMSNEELIRTALAALKACAQTAMNSQNIDVAIVGKDVPFHVLDEETLAPYLAELADDDAPAETEGDDGDEKME